MKPILVSLTTPDGSQELTRFPIPGFTLAPTGASAGQPLRGQISGQVTALIARVVEVLQGEGITSPLSPIEVRLRVSAALVLTSDEEPEAIIEIPVLVSQAFAPTAYHTAAPQISDPRFGADSQAPMDPAIERMVGMFDLTTPEDTAEDV